MIKKLYDLKKNEIDQKLAQKSKITSRVDNIDAQILLTKNKIDSATVQKFGSISDFSILTMHKNTMRTHIKKLEDEKSELKVSLESLQKDIIELQKESEQFKYILEEEKKDALKKLLLLEQETTDEFVQSKYIQG